MKRYFIESKKKHAECSHDMRLNIHFSDILGIHSSNTLISSRLGFPFRKNTSVKIFLILIFIMLLCRVNLNAADEYTFSIYNNVYDEWKVTNFLLYQYDVKSFKKKLVCPLIGQERGQNHLKKIPVDQVDANLNWLVTFDLEIPGWGNTTVSLKPNPDKSIGIWSKFGPKDFRESYNGAQVYELHGSVPPNKGFPPRIRSYFNIEIDYFYPLCVASRLVGANKMNYQYQRVFTWIYIQLNSVGQRTY